MNTVKRKLNEQELDAVKLTINGLRTIRKIKDEAQVYIYNLDSTILDLEEILEKNQP